MSIDLKTKSEYKTVLHSIIISSGMPFDTALDLLIDKLDDCYIDDFIELLVDKVTNK